jgi:hypothetical protein
VVGAGLGVAVFAIVGVIHASLTKRTGEDGYVPQIRLGALRGAAVGLPLGALAGALLRGERWRPVWPVNEAAAP